MEEEGEERGEDWQDRRASEKSKLFYAFDD